MPKHIERVEQCDRQCEDLGPEDLHRRRKKLGTKTRPLERKCCALSILQEQKPGAREATLRVIAAQISPAWAEELRSALISRGRQRRT